jgi:hypothetical protein
MNLLDYACYYMWWKQFEMLPLGLALKRGFQPLTKAVLVASISTLVHQNGYLAIGP